MRSTSQPDASAGALLFGSLAHHRRHGQRMLDTVLIAGRETERHFRLGVVLDLEHPFHASMDFIALARRPDRVRPAPDRPNGLVVSTR